MSNYTLIGLEILEYPDKILLRANETNNNNGCEVNLNLSIQFINDYQNREKASEKIQEQAIKLSEKYQTPITGNNYYD